MNIKAAIKKKIFNLIKVLYKMTYKYIPINNKMVIFVSYHGRGYLCNPKYIHKYMESREEYKDYKYIWAVRKSKNVNISNSKIVRYNSILYFYYMVRNKYWIKNCKMPSYILKKENQVYVQTWHGTPLKRLAHDIDIGDDKTFYRTKVTKKEMTKSYDTDVKRYNYFISPNKFSTEKFISAFRVNESKIIETGYPRNDYLSNITENEVLDLKIKYNIPLEKKVILYAPTWRDNSFNNKGYIFNLEVDFYYWKKRLGEEYIVLFKPHYLITNKYNNDDFNGFLYSVNEAEDINELYVISDILVTDYSSVFFDYAILNRPIYFYMYDLKDYEENLRGFYLDINKELPGEVITNEEKLLTLIKDNKKYYNENKTKITEFNKIYNNFQDGRCSERVIKYIL